jgi:MFS family permease
MAMVALILHVQRARGTGTAVAVVVVAEALPPLLAPWTGALADRFKGRRLLITCALLQAGITAVTALLLPGLAGLFALVLARASVASVYAPAAGALVPSLVDDADLPIANGLHGAAREFGAIFGAPLGGFLFAWLGTRGVLAVDAATFLLAVPLLATLPRRTPPGEARTAIRADAREGLAYLRRTPLLRAIAIGFWLTVVFAGADDLVLPFLGARDLGAGPLGIGILLAAASVGLVLGVALLSRLGRVTPVAAVLGGLALASAANLSTAAAPVLAAAIATQVIRGAGIALLDASLRTLVQRSVPRELLGRVLANLYGGVSVAAAFGSAVGGPLLDATSPRVMFVIIGCGGLGASALAGVLVRQSRREGGDRNGSPPSATW